jgi:hypothetical protein
LSKTVKVLLNQNRLKRTLEEVEELANDDIMKLWMCIGCAEELECSRNYCKIFCEECEA